MGAFVHSFISVIVSVPRLDLESPGQTVEFEVKSEAYHLLLWPQSVLNKNPHPVSVFSV